MTRQSLESEAEKILTKLMLNYSAEMYKYRNIMNPTTKWADLTAHQRSVVNSYRDEIKAALLKTVDRYVEERERLARIEEWEELAWSNEVSDETKDALEPYYLKRVEALRQQVKDDKENK